jgi:hypothetical protein
MELFTATGKLNKFFLQLEMFDVCTMGDTSIRYSSSCHTRVNMGALIFFTAPMICAFRFLINVCNHEEYYETPRKKVNLKCNSVWLYHTSLYNYLYTNCVFIIRQPDHGHRTDRNMLVMKYNLQLNIRKD